MSEELRKRKFLELLNEMEEAIKGYEIFIDCQKKFTKELIETIGKVTYEYFFGKTSCSDIIPHVELKEDEIIKQIASDEDFKYYGIWLFEELYEYMDDFIDDEIPAGRELRYKKIEYPSFTKEAIEEQMRKDQEEFRLPNKEQLETLRECYEEEARIRAFYTNFKILLHKTLKKLTVDYFPEIMEISSTGLREIEYLTYEYMLMIKQNLMKIV